MNGRQQRKLVCWQISFHRDRVTSKNRYLQTANLTCCENGKQQTKLVVRVTNSKLNLLWGLQTANLTCCENGKQQTRLVVRTTAKKIVMNLWRTVKKWVFMLLSLKFFTIRLVVRKCVSTASKVKLWRTVKKWFYLFLAFEFFTIWLVVRNWTWRILAKMNICFWSQD